MKSKGAVKPLVLLFAVIFIIVIVALFAPASGGMINRATSAIKDNFFSLPGELFQSIKKGDDEPSDVYSEPTIAADPSAKVGDKVEFVLGGADKLEEEVEKYVWRFGDNSNITTEKNKPVTHNFTKSGTYTVTLTLKDGQGDSFKTLNHEVEIKSEGETDNGDDGQDESKNEDQEEEKNGEDGQSDVSFPDGTNTLGIGEDIQKRGFRFLKQTYLDGETLGRHLKRAANNHNYVSREMLAAVLLRKSRIHDDTSQFSLDGSAGDYVGPMQIHRDILNWIDDYENENWGDYKEDRDGFGEDAYMSGDEENLENIKDAAKFLQAMAETLKTLPKNEPDNRVPSDLLLAFYQSGKGGGPIGPSFGGAPNVGADDPQEVVNKFDSSKWGKDYEAVYDKYDDRTRQFVKNTYKWQEELEDCPDCFVSIESECESMEDSTYWRDTCWRLTLKMSSNQGLNCSQKCDEVDKECVGPGKIFPPIIEDYGNLDKFFEGFCSEIEDGLDLEREAETRPIPADSSFANNHPLPLLAVKADQVVCYLPRPDKGGWDDKYVCGDDFPHPESVGDLVLYGSESEVRKQRLCACK